MKIADALLEYPMAQCSRHSSGPQLCYFVCVHVLRGERKVHEFQAPTAEEAGHIICAECNDTFLEVPDDYEIVCARCQDEDNKLEGVQ